MNFVDTSPTCRITFCYGAWLLKYILASYPLAAPCRSEFYATSVTPSRQDWTAARARCGGLRQALPRGRRPGRGRRWYTCPKAASQCRRRIRFPTAQRGGPADSGFGTLPHNAIYNGAPSLPVYLVPADSAQYM